MPDQPTGQDPVTVPALAPAPSTVPTPPPPPSYLPRHWDLANRIMVAALVESKGIDAGPAIRHRFAMALREREDWGVECGRIRGWNEHVDHLTTTKPPRRWWEWWK